MIKTIAIGLLLFAGTSAFANNKATLLEQDSSQITNNQIRSASMQADTLFGVDMISNPLLSHQNIIYKQRLDSLERSVPLTYNEHVQNFIELYVFRRKEQIGKMLGLSKYYFPIFERSFKEVGIPDEIKFISVIESALNPNAVSRSGAVGPWQFMYTTAKGYGLVIDNYVDERKDPVQASYAAAKYLKEAYNELGDWLLAIAAYNCGTGAVTRAIARSGGQADYWKIRSYLPRETQNYVPAFIATVYAMNYYSKHEIYPMLPGFNTMTDVIDVNRFVSFSRIAKAADIGLDEIKMLNPSYKKQIVNGSEASPKRLVIPAVGKQVYASLYDVLNSPENIDEPQVIAANYLEDSPPIRIPENHRVQEGQTLMMVANQYGIEVQDLIVFNNLKVIEVVPGQLLKLKDGKPASKATSTRSHYITYIVKAGDNLSKIANKFSGTSISKIKALNGLKKSSVSPGMRLKINKG